jgi:cation transport regulator ChaC
LERIAMDETVWYFAYGSNLWSEQMERRTGAIRSVSDRPRVARLPNYRLAFNKRGSEGQAFANIMPAAGDVVIGVVYPCQPSALEKMDEYESGYLRRAVRVLIDDGSTVEAIAYVATGKNLVDNARPSGEYVTRILTGAAEHGLPHDYIEKIKLLASVGKH